MMNAKMRCMPTTMYKEDNRLWHYMFSLLNFKSLIQLVEKDLIVEVRKLTYLK